MCVLSGEVGFDLSSLVNATPHTLDNEPQPVANWMLNVQEVKDEMETMISIKFATADTNFQGRVAKPFFTSLKYDIQNQFNSQDVVSSFSIFDFKKHQLMNRSSSYV